MALQGNLQFSDVNIEKIFGTYDGESEDITRLKEYYFKTETYDTIISDLPLRILIGNKGVGKSAMFRYAIAESKESDRMVILIRPDDVAEIWDKYENLILSIKKWKNGLTDVIVKKVLEELDLDISNVNTNSLTFGNKIFPLITHMVNAVASGTIQSVEQQRRISDFLHQKKLVVYLDDLDRGWQNRKEGVIMISALINTIRDLSNQNQGLSFKLALRYDVYIAVRIADESSDKYEGSVIIHSYRIHEIFILLIKRILTFFDEPFDEKNLVRTEQRHLAYHLNAIFEPTFSGSGKWKNKAMYKVILSLIRNRPRDLVKLCTMAGRAAFKDRSPQIKSIHIQNILKDYSTSIINDTIAEYKSELPSIERLIYGMRPSKKEKFAQDSFVFTTIEIHQKLFNIIQQGNFRFASGTDGDAHTLKNFLYKINFLTARKVMEDGTIKRSNYEENPNLSSLYMNQGYDWEVHLAYRWVLQAESVEEIIDRIAID